MESNIIQHHEYFDFESFYETIRKGYISIDNHDFDLFMNTEGVKHSFIGMADGENRIHDALTGILSSDSDIIRQASTMIITVIRSLEAKQPLSIKEMQFITDFLSNLSSGCEVIWGLTDDSSLGNKVKVIILINIK